MISRKKLLRGIDDAIETQKRLVTLLNRHIAAAIAHGSLHAQEKETMLEKFHAMVITHTKHSAVLQVIKEDVLSGDSNVY